MADINSVQYTNASATPATFNRVGDEGGKVRVARFDVDFTAEAAGATLNLCYLPAGATFLYAGLMFEGTSSLTLDIGDASDTDRLVVAADLGTDSPTTGNVLKIFGRLESTASAATPSVGIGYRYTARTLITGTTAGATATAGEVLRGFIAYTLD